MTVAERVRRSRQEQGLPPQIEDPGTLALLAAIVAAAGRGDESR